MILSFAPMEGITGANFRRAHRAMFPGADRYYAPFVAPDAEGRFKQSHLRTLLPECNEGLTLVPQILAGRASAFLGAARTLAELGYREVNLNAGCPSGTVVSKHKGAGLLADPAALDALLDAIFSETPVAISVKTRMGLNSTAEFPALLEVYNRYPITELIVHARDRAGLYRSQPDFEGFAKAMKSCRCPICWSGNVFSARDLAELKTRLPGLERVMLGRGAVTNPALFRECRGGERLQKEELAAFHDRLLAGALAAGLSPAHALARMKELWYYWEWLFPGEDRRVKAVYKARTADDYRAAVSQLFTQGSFDPAAVFGG